MAIDDTLLSLGAEALPLLHELGEVLQLGIFTLDTELVVRGWNRWMAAASGAPSATMVGRPLFDAYPELRGTAAESALRRALDAGLNLVDTAPMYEDGLSEEIVGEALRGRREGVFVVDKIDLLDEPVAPQVDASLARLGLPHVELLAFHSVSDLAAWRRIAAPGGPMDELAEEVRRGRARFRGI